jgi:isocitrate dehydrogenase (NAD+)
MFEPVHGSAPKYAGQKKVNPVATIFAGKMLLDYLDEKNSAGTIEKAVYQVLKEGKSLTYDLGGKSTTDEMAEAIIEKLGS